MKKGSLHASFSSGSAAAFPGGDGRIECLVGWSSPSSEERRPLCSNVGFGFVQCIKKKTFVRIGRPRSR